MKRNDVVFVEIGGEILTGNAIDVAQYLAFKDGQDLFDQGGKLFLKRRGETRVLEILLEDCFFIGKHELRVCETVESLAKDLSYKSDAFEHECSKPEVIEMITVKPMMCGRVIIGVNTEEAGEVTISHGSVIISRQGFPEFRLVGKK